MIFFKADLTSIKTSFKDLNKNESNLCAVDSHHVKKIREKVKFKKEKKNCKKI